MGSDSITATLRTATADPHIKAIVLRVNSPGGSYVASDSIWREVVRARNAGKPVVVSMGDVAASGGYFISMAADAIVAQPGTITGSIGVISGKPVLSDAFGKIGRHRPTRSCSASTPGCSRPRTRSPATSGTSSMPGSTGSTPTSPARSRPAAACRPSGCTSSPGPGLDRRRRHEDNGLVDELGGIEEAAAIARRQGRPARHRPARALPEDSARSTGSAGQPTARTAAGPRPAHRWRAPGSAARPAARADLGPAATAAGGQPARRELGSGVAGRRQAAGCPPQARCCSQAPGHFIDGTNRQPPTRPPDSSRRSGRSPAASRS